MFVFSKRSEGNLAGVHPDLVRVIRRALTLSTVDFTVIEGVRTLARQKQLKASGASTTLNSRHIPAANGYAHAVDIAPFVGEIRWDWPLYHLLARAVKEAAKLEGVPIEWGGDWKSFKDGPHWQLPWAQYPGK
ncbi:peptidoglycan L-alanyl-D-glutamate endopeptidase CwlK [Devosia enhydra]|uniref:Peptidoglycan L-alanyl-D-glutamate endopeptidase CwlK n=1 Tax=Devosia enhydra TaxID=665118 RepID=A0A1K2HUG1_9HYPH|nr:M15 family metallopeptidase [Devosia enhydra]SFZ81707.1 peptidoglycan L-alanyl-D-glutamate endopeptidase CwlK [Devosia enhydra]